MTWSNSFAVCPQLPIPINPVKYSRKSSFSLTGIKRRRWRSLLYGPAVEALHKKRKSPKKQFGDRSRLGDFCFFCGPAVEFLKKKQKPPKQQFGDCSLLGFFLFLSKAYCRRDHWDPEAQML